LHPRVGNRDRRAAEAGNGRAGRDIEFPVGVVHLHLRDGDRVGTAIGQFDHNLVVRRQRNSIDCQLLNRRRGARAEACTSDHQHRQEYAEQQ
jgi:hypothetical protein